VTLFDLDDTQLEGATVAITGGFESGEDSLSFANQNGITGSYTVATGILTLSGTATLVDYETALQSVAYANSSDAPDETDREITFTVNDGTADSAVATSTVTVASVNDAPTILGATSPGSILVNDNDVWDHYQYWAHGVSKHANGAFYANDELTFNMTGLPQSGISFRLFGDDNQTPQGLVYGEILTNEIPGIRVSAGETQVFTHVLTEDEASMWYRGDASGVGGNPGFEMDASVVSGKLDVDEDSSATFSGLSIADPDIGGGEIIVALSVSEGALVLGTSAGLTQTDHDGSDGTLAFSGTLADVNSALAQLEYAGNLNFSGQDFLELTVNDQGNSGIDPGLTGDATSEEQTRSVVINVAEVNDAPVATNATANVTLSAALDPLPATGDLSGDASDIEMEVLTFEQVGTVAGLTINPDGSWVFDRGAAAYGSLGAGEAEDVVAVFSVTDPGSLSDTATLTLQLTGVNDAPVTNPDTATTAEDTPVSIAVLDNDTDVDGDVLVVGGLTQPANGTVAVNAAGEVTYTPDRNFNGVDTFTYVSSDGVGGDVTGSVSVTVTSVDDPVIARADFASTNQETPVVIEVLSNDEDPEAAPLSISSVGTAGNGLVTSDGSAVTYTPNNGFFGVDTFSYEVTDDTAGSVSQTATVVVNQDPAGFSIENLPTLAFNLTGGGGSPAGSVTIEVDPVASNGVNIAFGLDESGSISFSEFTIMVNSVKAAVAELAGNFAGSSTSLDIHITPFDSNVDTSGAMKPQSFTVHTAAGVTSLTAFNTYMDGVKAAYNGGGTNWDAADLNIKSFFDVQETNAAADVNVTYFITDGNPNVYGSTSWQTTTATLRNSPLDVDIKAFAIGSNITAGNLTLIDPDFDSNTQTLASASDLTAAFSESPLFNARLADFSLVLVRDGESLGEIADESIFTTPLTSISFELPLADIVGLSGLLGDTNTFIATAKFDTDGNLSTTADVLQIVTQGSFSKAADAQNLTGTPENDLLLGSDLDDTLDGGDGDDVLLGFGGSDSLSGGLGDDKISISATSAQWIDGGAGRDVLTFQTDADITSAMLTALNIQNIESLNLTNNENNVLTLTADTVFDLSSTADTDLTAQLSAIFSGVSEVVSVLGETGDTAILEDSATRFYRKSPEETVTLNGRVVDVYAIEDSGGTIIGAIGVDRDIAVSFQNMAANIALDDNYNPGGSPNVTENAPVTLAFSTLLANDILVSQSTTVTAVSNFSSLGATVELSGGDVIYNPLSSKVLDDLNTSQTATDTFTYTISDGATTDTATVTLTVSGVNDLDAPPVISSTQMSGFASGNSNQYRFGFRLEDGDNASGITYLLHDGTGPISAPTGVTYSATFNDFSFTPSAQTNYTDGLSIYGYEADGQYMSIDFGYSVDGDGALRFFYSKFDEADGGPVLEIGLGSGSATVDLSGIEALAPDVLRDASVIDMRNGQLNDFELTAADLLNMIEGNDPTATEHFKLQMDNDDTYIFLDDAVSAANWSADIASGTTYNLTDTTAGDAGDPGSFGIIGEIFATLEIDGGGQGFQAV